MQTAFRLGVAVATVTGAAACTDAPDTSIERTASAPAAEPSPDMVPNGADAIVRPARPSAADTTCAPDAIDDPADFVWTQKNGYWLGSLEVSQATFDIGGDTLTTRAYRQPGVSDHSIPGPTIRMTPGEKYVLRFENRLPYEPLETGENVFKDPNASNVHTHGLHISGESPGDDVTRTFEGGHGGDFVYDIPTDHMGGTFWYHAHHHGSTFLQVSGGTFGSIIIDDDADGLPANVANMTERNLLLGYLDPGAKGTGGDTLLDGTLSPTWTINGQKNGSLCIPANEWQHWRVLVADRDAKPKNVTFGAGCEVALMARDGVWRTEIPKELPTRTLSLTGASRADFAVRCGADSTLTVGNATVANIVVGAEGDTSVHPYAADGVSTWSANRPAYLRDLSGVPNNQLNSETIRMGARTVNGSKFDHHTPNLTLPADSVQDWTINGAAQHPFHLHVYHMQAFGCSGDFEDGEYYDVIASNCGVRFDLDAGTSSPYSGRTVMHCHILEHEDQGAMGWAQVTGGAAPPTLPADGTVSPPLAEYYQLCDTSEAACGDGVDNDCDGNTDCDDSECTGDPACTGPVCGDLTCDAGESQCSCASDCGSPPGSESICDDGVDEDCDGNTDCDDADCTEDPACGGGSTGGGSTGGGSSCGDGTCDPGEDCDSCGSDCASVTKGPPSGRHCCGDGTAQSAEGDGTICDGNY